MREGPQLPNCHLLVATLGLPLSICSTPANVHDIKDTVGACKLLGGLGPLALQLKKFWAAAAYHGKELVE